MVRLLRLRNERNRVFVTASTGTHERPTRFLWLNRFQVLPALQSEAPPCIHGLGLGWEKVQLTS